jgi:hypothetical protein
MRTQRTAQRHAERPTQLHRAQIVANHLAIFQVECFQPFPDRQVAGRRPVKGDADSFFAVWSHR